VNTKFWDGLTPDEKNVLTYSARSAIVAGRGMGRAIEASNKGLAALSKTMKVNSLTNEQKKSSRTRPYPR